MKAAGQGASAAANTATKGKLPTERKKDTKDCVIIRYRGFTKVCVIIDVHWSGVWSNRCIVTSVAVFLLLFHLYFQAQDGIQDFGLSGGLGEGYKR